MRNVMRKMISYGAGALVILIMVELALRGTVDWQAFLLGAFGLFIALPLVVSLFSGVSLLFALAYRSIRKAIRLRLTAKRPSANN